MSDKPEQPPSLVCRLLDRRKAERAERAKTARTPQQIAKSVYDFIKTVLLAMLLAFGFRSVALEPFTIPSGSMIPTLLIGDYLFVSKISYGYSRFSFPFSLPLFQGRLFGSAPKRGDVVVFRLPRDTSVDYIKRVIGLPGDRVQMRQGRLYIDGTLVPRRGTADYEWQNGRGSRLRFHRYVETLPGGVEHLIIENSDHGMFDNTPEYVVPEGHYFMMGDNRDNSLDSRADVGFVPFANLIGRAEFIFYSFDDAAAFWEVWKWPWAIRLGRLFHSIGPLEDSGDGAAVVRRETGNR